MTTTACTCRCITAIVQLQDGALNDEELNRFQIKCFHAPLQPTELAGVKEVVGERLPGVSTSIFHCLCDFCLSQEPLHHVKIVTVYTQKAVVCCDLYTAHRLLAICFARYPPPETPFSPYVF